MGKDKSNYLLEALEPRILLSGDGLLQSGLVLGERPIDLFTEVEEYELNRQTVNLEQANIYNPEARLPDLFDGIQQETPKESDDQDDDTERELSLLDKAPPTQPFNSFSNDEAQIQALKHEGIIASEAAFSLITENSLEKHGTQCDVCIPSAGNGQSSMADELVETLKAANPPPNCEPTISIYPTDEYEISPEEEGGKNA